MFRGITLQYILVDRLCTRIRQLMTDDNNNNKYTNHSNDNNDDDDDKRMMSLG